MDYRRMSSFRIGRPMPSMMPIKVGVQGQNIPSQNTSTEQRVIPFGANRPDFKGMFAAKREALAKALMRDE